MPNAKILIIEDDKKLAQLMRDYLSNHAFQVTVENSGDKGLYRITKDQPDVVILDIMLPKMDGLTVCRESRQYYDGLILMLTAREEDETEIKSLENGADDFVRKPIDPSVLVARINALLRRKLGEVKPLELEIGTLKIDPASQLVYWHNKLIELSRKEFEVLYFLADQAGKVVNRDSISQALKGFDHDGVNRTIDMTISTLRKKFHDDGREAKLIKTVWGKGYLFVKEAWSE
ncbi:MAG: response regulator transcription factor [Gammaproteobacteria bacterium]|nr:response regulator transcription factor [Gammaproteobacteria bacterium]